MAKRLDPIHPGEVLHEEIVGPLGIAQCRLAHTISAPPRRVNEIVHGNRAISADTALRLARFFGTGAQLWLNLEARYGLETERDRFSARLTSDVKIFAGPVQYWRGH